MIRPRPGVGLVLVLAVLAAGCGRKAGNVSGTVKFNDKPLTAGTITFYDRDDRPTSSPISATGTYSVTGVASGKVKVAIAVPLPISFAGLGGKATPTAQASTPTIP